MYYLFCQVYRGDGSCVYGDEEHAERVEGLLEEFDRTRERVLATAERAVEEANRIFALEHRDPTNALSAGELEEANAKREFVKEDCETMPLPDLAIGRRRRWPPAIRRAYSSTRYARERHRRESECPGPAVSIGLKELAPILADPKAERKLSEAREAVAASENGCCTEAPDALQGPYA